ncbi:MAG: hypothetical protein EU539_00820 [Promethearchaeota archaeon]|nr:MAG: hypothetical protein EU539_00820 [Candidatus Lokiarchaeota archaeon]
MNAKFLSEHFINEMIDVYCGAKDTFTGKVLYCADDVLTIESEDKTMTFISIPKIIAVWKAKE